jgi:hypothetical protein
LPLYMEGAEKKDERKKGEGRLSIGARMISAFTRSAHYSRKCCVVAFGPSSKDTTVMHEKT